MEGLRTRNGAGARPIALSGRQGRPRSPGVAYAVLTLALAMLVGALTLTSRQSAPPTIAEFAPQAVEQITDSSGDLSGSRAGATEQTSSLDEGAGADDAASRSFDVARVRRCVGDPPRQIEDPQSPPCVPYWSGDNGGATAKGVTRDEVRIAAPWAGVNVALQQFFNSRFELYGRKMRLIDTRWSGDCSQAGSESMAVAADETWKVFGSMLDGCGPSHYAVALARRGIISTLLSPTFTEPFMRDHAPYMWSYPMALDAVQIMQGDWACNRLAGHRAQYAKGPESLSRRVFGIFSATLQAEYRIDTTPLQRRLEACGERSAATFEMSGLPWIQDGQSAQMFQNVVLQMRQNGVTTIFCLCHPGGWNPLGTAATSNGYFPEWLIGTIDFNDWNWNIRTFGPGPEQRAQALGLTVLPRQTSVADNPAYWADEEGSPGGRRDRSSQLDAYIVTLHYRDLLLLASGIQMAGPHLTPQTFERGLHRAVFPNPDHPINAGKVGFMNGDHSMTEDVAEFWWSNTDKGPYYDDAGTICYVDHGDRRALGRFPSGDEPYFKGPCDSGA